MNNKYISSILNIKKEFDDIIEERNKTMNRIMSKNEYNERYIILLKFYKSLKKYEKDEHIAMIKLISIMINREPNIKKEDKDMLLTILYNNKND
jgi:hypothetical protein